MNDPKINYDEEADVLYVSFQQNKNVTGVELADNILLRLDTGKTSGKPPSAVGLTFINFSFLQAAYQNRPFTVPISNLRNLPEDLWQAVIAVVTTSPVSDFLDVGLSFSPHIPPIPDLIESVVS
jgi:hypothetical protein